MRRQIEKRLATPRGGIAHRRNDDVVLELEISLHEAEAEAAVCACDEDCFRHVANEVVGISRCDRW